MKKKLLTLALMLMAFTANAQSTIKGDVDSDGTVSVTDIAMIVNYILGVNDNNFIAANADINSDGEIDINDVMATVSIILGDDGGNGNGNGDIGDTSQAYLTCPDDNHPHLIDLGLPSGTKWACSNKYASVPSGYGSYYEFGEVATAPSLDQILELLDNCSYKWTTFNDVEGGQFTGKNGGTIFLPAAGSYWYYDLAEVGVSGQYWSSTPGDESSAFLLYFDSYGAYWGLQDYLHSSTTGMRPVRSVR